MKLVSEVELGAIVVVVVDAVVVSGLDVVVVDVVVTGSDSCFGSLGANTRGICWIKFNGLFSFSVVFSVCSS